MFKSEISLVKLDSDVLKKILGTRWLRTDEIVTLLRSMEQGIPSDYFCRLAAHVKGVIPSTELLYVFGRKDPWRVDGNSYTKRKNNSNAV